MNYRGFEVRENARTGQWQAVRHTDLLWTDGITAADRFALKTAIDLHLAHTPPNPWQLPLVQEVPIAA
jgi:hypothetical protein